MRIGITCYPTYGGSGALATELGLELARRGHEVHFITYASPFRLRTGGYNERVYYHEVETRMGRYPLFEHYPYTLALASKQHEVAKRENLDLLHVHYAIPHAAAAHLAREMLKPERDLKVITTLHGTDITLVGQEASFYAITKFSIEQSSRTTAVSEFLRDETYRAFGCVTCDLKVIPNFVNLEEYQAVAAAPRHGLAPDDHKVICHVSNFREVKRIKDVIRVFARIRRAMPATLLMIGDGPDRGDAEREAAELDVDKDVKFLGRLEHVAEILQCSDLFLLPSQSESFGLAALEAMACGAPVVATRAGGLPEVISDGVNGILEPVGSVEAMGRRAVDLLRDPAAHRQMRDAAIAAARAFSADRIVPMYESLYKETLSE